MISDEIVALIEGGASMAVATRDAQLVPSCMRAMGVRVHADRRTLDVFLPAATAGRTRANLAVSPEAAVSFSRPRDHRTVQMKGPVRVVREARADEQAFVDAYRHAFARQLDFVGMPPAYTLHIAWWPCVVIEVVVRDIFQQTPGPGAGARLVEGAR